MNTLTGKSKGWANHPAVQQWKGYEFQLFVYGIVICFEWINRGYKDTVRDKLLMMAPKANYRIPPWLGNEKYHSSHRANLLRKDPIWYGKFGWTEDPSAPYFWPSKEGYNG